ncbi:MAG TPA: sialate O-acetylesterase [Pseudoxanthomonas sp.]|nr:sialate O-acetylesterase [Pseudoxanthomonas sp.]
MPLVFSDGAVLQRDQPLPVWGRATPGARIRVSFDGREATATAGGDGTWRVELPAHAAGGPFQLRVREGDADEVAVRDVLVGEVWLASGQSNMEWPLSQAADAEAEIARANDPLVRHFKVPKSWSDEAQWQLAGGEWVAASPQTAGNFSAVAYFFARQLRQKLGVPVGIIDSSWGGSSIEAWSDAKTLGLSPQQLAERGREMREANQAALAKTREKLARWKLPADDSGWQAADADESAWAPIAVPGLWESEGYNGVDGVAWYRAQFTLTAAQARAGATLGVGRVDDTDTTWVNGVQVGHTRQQYNLPRAYEVPASALHAGVNHVAVRVEDTGGGGGIHGVPAEVFVQPAQGARLALQGWRFRPAQASVSMMDDKNQVPTLLYNAMVHPLQPYAIAGAIWYQGEANAGTTAQALAYRQQFPAMIEQWRAQWHAPKLPFLWVQLANWVSGADQGDSSPWSVLRESQSKTLSLPATAQAVTIDIGNPDDIHPRNKQDVGKRLALAARHVAYAETLVYSGPVFAGMQVERGMATLSFARGNGALAVRGGGNDVHGFRLAGADRVFHPAKAVVRGDKVVAQSDAVPVPVAVRYAWSDNPADADLANDVGLPASPFRSDNW